MYSHQIEHYGGPDAVRWVEVPEPVNGSEVLVDVWAAGVSFADLLQTRGEYQMKPPLPYSPGMDAAGVVRWAPPGSPIGVGERVAVLMRHGCWQEVVSVPEERVLALPDDVSLDVAAALPLNYLTGLFALLIRGRAQAGETLVVHGAAGGVGSAAIQLGRTLGLRVVAVTDGEAKQVAARQCGANHAVSVDGWLNQVREITGDRTVDLVFDPVGGGRMTDNLRSLAPGGRVLVVGFAAGEIPTVKVNRLLLGNTGVLGAASLEYFGQRPEVIGELWDRLMGLRATGPGVDPPIQRYPFPEVRAGLRAIADREARGKVVLTRGQAAG